MKKFRQLTILLGLIMVLSVFLSACDAISRLLNNQKQEDDYEYSEDGKDEVIEFYAKMRQDDFEGEMKYKLIVDSKISYISVYREKVGDKFNMAFNYKDEQDEFSLITIGDARYYVDYGLKKVANDTQSLMKGFVVVNYLNYYGIVDMQDKDWEFVEKRDVQIMDKESKNINTVEFEYALNSIETNEELTLYVNFDKKKPEILRNKLKIYNVVELTEQTGIAYVLEVKEGDVDKSVFYIPSQADGYTVEIN